MKIKRFNEMNEGMRINTKILTLYDSVPIDKAIKELVKLQTNPRNIFGLYGIDIDILLDDVIDNINTLKSWEKSGATKVEGNGTEWIPIWD